MLLYVCYNCCGTRINVKGTMGKSELHFLAKKTLNNSEDRQRKEAQKHQGPPSHSPQRKALGKLKNKYLRDLKYKMTRGILQPAMPPEKFSVT